MRSSARDLKSASNGYGMILWKRDLEAVIQEARAPNQYDIVRDRAEVARITYAFPLLHVAVVNEPLLEV